MSGVLWARIIPSCGWRVFRLAVAAAFEPSGFPSLRSWRVRAGRVCEFAGLRAAFRAPRGRFPGLLRRRARVSGFSRQVSRVAVANCLHAGPESRKTCQRTPVSVHSDSESRETRHARKRGGQTPARCLRQSWGNGEGLWTQRVYLSQEMKAQVMTRGFARRRAFWGLPWTSGWPAWSFSVRLFASQASRRA